MNGFTVHIAGRKDVSFNWLAHAKDFAIATMTECPSVAKVEITAPGGYYAILERTNEP